MNVSVQELSRNHYLERDVFMLINHDWNKVVGRTGSNLVLEEDENGLRFELDIPNTTDGQ